MTRPFSANARSIWLVSAIRPLLSNPTKILEIGLACGHFSKQLQKYFPSAEISAVDPYIYDANMLMDVADNDLVFAPYRDAWSSQAALDEFFDNTVLGLNPHLTSADDDPETEDSRLYRMTSEAAVDKFDDASLDLIYVDGDHSHDAVLSDLRLYWPKLKVGGVLAGDDYENVHGWGVISAVDQFAAEEELTLNVQTEEETATRQWWFTKS